MSFKVTPSNNAKEISSKYANSPTQQHGSMAYSDLHLFCAIVAVKEETENSTTRSVSFSSLLRLA